MERLPIRLEGPLLLKPQVFGDERGFFQETYRESLFEDQFGIEGPWVQDNHSRSRQGIVRGLHFQIGAGAAKLIRCGRGAIYDVLVDLRRGSPTFGQWEGYDLNDQNMHILFAPIGFAHGFCVVSDVADVIYKQSNYYSTETERGIAWNDPDVGVEWPSGLDFQVSERDENAPSLADVADELPFQYGG